MQTQRHRRRFLSWLILLSLFLQLLIPAGRAYAAPPSSPRSQTGPLAPASAHAETPVQALFIHDQDDATVNELETLLTQNGVAMDALRLSEPGGPTLNNHTYLPLIQSGPGGGGKAGARFSAADPPNINDYDIVILSADLDKDGGLAMSDDLVQAILASGRPVLGFGSGGARFFDVPQLALGLSKSVPASGRQAMRQDGNASLPLYSGPNPVPTDGSIDLYTGDQSGVAIPMGQPKPTIKRYASLASAADQIIIARQGERWALWGLSGGPDAMTDNGRNLLVNLIWQLTGDAVEIPMAAGALSPEPGVEPALAEALAGGQPQYALVQLYAQPTPDVRATLDGFGVHLLEFLTGNVYSAAIAPTTDLNNPDLLALVRFMGAYKPDYKVSPALSQSTARSAQEEPVIYEEVGVIFFDNVSLEAIQETLAKYVGSDYRQGATPTEWIIANQPETVAQIAQEPIVRFIAPFTPPADLNDTARPLVNTDDVQDAVINGGSIQYLGLTGQGVRVGHFERRADVAHPDLAGRIAIGANASPNTSDHATHVAGIILGDGGDSAANGGSAFQFRGHAPEATIVSESYASNAPDNFSDAYRNFDAELSTHSYLQSNTIYDASARTVDRVVRGDATDSSSNAIPARPAMWAAGNNGSIAQYGNEEGFYSVFTSAKNSISVGSIDTVDSIPSDFSSRGPTFDGRIKPDVTAPGCNDSGPVPSIGIQSTSMGGGYVGKCGTSMSTPLVAAIGALMMEQYHKTFGATAMPLPSTIKALLVNTAADMVGTSDFNDPDCNCTFNYAAGPDWTTGYGMVDAEAAVAAMRSKSFLEDEVSPGDLVDEYTIQVTAGQPELRFTLAWDDEPGDTSTAETAAKLVNDLDLLLIAPDNTQNFPWVLDPLPLTANPGDGAQDPISQNDINNNPARRDVNDRDNVEQVVVNNPMAGTWTIRVTASALPNNNAQPYSLAGDFRTLNIVDPQTGNVAEAGDPANPNTILVVVEAVQPYATDTSSSLVDAEAGDFAVEIDGTSANVISGLPVGDQFWLNVRPQSGVYSAGSKYDLTVRWLGHGADSETRAVLFTEREVTDRAIVLDHSGSMSSYDKMGAAQNAARLFIDQSLVGDRVAVVGFSTNTSTPYATTEVSSDPTTPELNAAKIAVDSFSPTNMTAIGKGLLEGQTQVTAAPADFSLLDVIVLLSDGMENVSPYYDTPAVKGVIEPTDTIVHTVAVGPSSAGHHALLQQIAADNGGEFRAVTEDGAALAAAAVTGANAVNAADAAPDAAAGAESAAAIQTTGIDAWPATLPNRLADNYKQFAEDILAENRIFQAQAAAVAQNGRHDYSIQAPDDLVRLTFALNWSIPSHMLRLVVTDPAGKQYQYDPKANPFCRTDATHETCIIDKPQGGTWRITVLFVETGKDNEYMLWVSAKTSVNFLLSIGTPAKDQIVQSPIHIIGFLSEQGKPLAGQKVMVNVFGPASFQGGDQLVLYDDGMHDDGAANDGIYANHYMDGRREGAYAVRGVATGDTLEGKPFELYAETGFSLRPRVLYVYENDEETGRAYEQLVEANGVGVDVVPVDDVPDQDLRRYSLVIVGPDTGNQDKWGSDEAFSHIVRNERPVLGLGEGGYAFFGKLKLTLGYPNGAHGQGTTIQVTNFGDAIWDYPYEFDMNRFKFMQLYEENSPRVDIFTNNETPPGVVIFGLNDNDSRYTDLAQESGWWTFWGFQDGPKQMTEEGRQLFVNTVFRAMQ